MLPLTNNVDELTWKIKFIKFTCDRLGWEEEEVRKLYTDDVLTEMYLKASQIINIERY